MGPSVVQNTKTERIIFHLKEFENPKGRKGQGGWEKEDEEEFFCF